MDKLNSSDDIHHMGREHRTYVIAEIGVNHDGSLPKALEMVSAVAASGADAVKIQTFKAETLVSERAPKAAYQLATTPTSESQFEMLKRLELSRDEHWAIMEAAVEHGLDFLSTPYDPQSLSFLVNEMNVNQIKIASSDITNLPLLLAAGRSGKKVILSTGMSTIEEIGQGLATIGFGGTRKEGSPTLSQIASWDDVSLQQYLPNHVVLMQCTSQYPAPVDEANLQAISTLRDLFGVPVGYSDHTIGTLAAVMSVAYGASMYERHFTLDRMAPGPDHAASLEPVEFTALVAAIREAEKARGSGVKEPSPGEVGNRYPMRKGLIAARNIAAGEVITASDITCRRPAMGDPPSRFWSWVGKVADRNFTVGDPLSSDDHV